jgi:hypothetical protein
MSPFVWFGPWMPFWPPLKRRAIDLSKLREAVELKLAMGFFND